MDPPSLWVVRFENGLGKALQLGHCRTFRLAPQHEDSGIRSRLFESCQTLAAGTR